MSKQYWCCSADFGSHDSNCPNARLALAEAKLREFGQVWEEGKGYVFDPEAEDGCPHGSTFLVNGGCALCNESET